MTTTGTTHVDELESTDRPEPRTDKRRRSRRDVSVDGENGTSELLDGDDRRGGENDSSTVGGATGTTKATRSYRDFLKSKRQWGNDSGFEPTFAPDCLFDFQRSLCDWAIRKGRASIFADCGLVKSIMQLVWAENVVRHTNKPVLIVTHIAVGAQTVEEATKFGLHATVSRDGKTSTKITVTNYERLHYFSPSDFSGVVCDESSIIKNCDSKTKYAVGEFMRTLQYRLLCTATAAPNDWHELGTSSDVLGYLGFRDMITMFFKQETSKDCRGWGRTKYRFREHGKRDFWRWVCSWARACRRPSDLGFSDERFALPPLETVSHVVRRTNKRAGFLFEMPARDMNEQREERRATIKERCEKVSELVNHDRPSVMWCHLNTEGDLLEKIVPGSIQVSGSDSEDDKEAKLQAFSRGDELKLIIKPKIGAWGLNWQHCAHMTTFPSHSYEQYYQAMRRFWRFGQKNTVRVDIVTTEGEQAVTQNLQRKSDQVDEMFTALVAEMNESMVIQRSDEFHQPEAIPSWL